MLDGPIFPRAGDPGHKPALRLLAVGLLALPTGLVFCAAVTSGLGALFALASAEQLDSAALPLQGFDEAILLAGPWVGTLPVALAVGLLAWWKPALRQAFLVGAAVVWLGVLPIWGWMLDLWAPDCNVPCQSIYRPLGGTGLFTFACYGASLAAFVASRLSTAGGWAADLGLGAGLGLGLAVCGLLTAQFGGGIPMGVVYIALGAPLIAPAAASLAFGGELFRRMVLLKRAGPVGGGLGIAAGALGLDGLLYWVATGRVDPLGGELTQTCGWTFSQLTPPPGDCHYLCTVAAQGHPWLVKPLRHGVRRGRPIVVNRQLAVANAFEDLLHERWPRFGAWARRTYDRLGRPICRYLLHPLAADAVFVAMLPLQWGFEVFLNLLDHEPERRIDRMYRG